MKNIFFYSQNKVHYKNFFWLLIICLLAYWPLTFGVFSVKNDAIHEFLPYRFNIAEAIRNGEMPFWSPYVYLGNPIYGDMQSGAWNPFVWFFSLFGKYNITIFHLEYLIYIFLGGAGMYRLTHMLTQHTRTAFLIAASYMLSGFMLSGQLIHWTAAAAFLPFVIFYYLRSLSKPTITNGAKTGIALFILFTTAYPSFFILTCYLLLVHILIIVISRLKAKSPQLVSWKQIIKLFLITSVVFISLSLPAIVSYIDMLPHYSRGSGTSYRDTLSNSFELQHLLTFFFPGALNTTDMQSTTDITCRSVFIGLFPLIMLAAFPPTLNRRNIMLIIFAVFALLFSLGDETPIRKLCYDFIPLMNTFRHPSQLRLFLILSLLLLTAPGLKRLLNTNPSLNNIKTASHIVVVSFLLITLLAAIDSHIINEILHFNFPGVRDALKNIITSLSLADAVAISGCIQIVFLAIFLWLLKKHLLNKKWFSAIWVVNLFVMAQLALPVSFVSKTSPKEINAIINASPEGFPVGPLGNSLFSNSTDAFDNYEKASLSFFYNKKIGISRVAYTPSFLDEQGRFLDTRLLYNYVASRPVVYIADSTILIKDTAILNTIGSCNYAVMDTAASIKRSCNSKNSAVITNMSSNHFEIETKNISQALLVLTQSYYHHWKALVNDKPEKIHRVNSAFMGIYLQPGNHKVIFKFVPANTIKAMWVMASAVLMLGVFFGVSLFRRKKHAVIN